MSPLLRAVALAARYGGVEALRPIEFEIGMGEVVVILGPNGAGKTTLLRALMGLVDRSGRVFFDGEEVTGLATLALVEAGIAMVPEGRGIFGPLTVAENLALGAYARRKSATPAAIEADRRAVLALFPRLEQRLAQRAGSLSGGEQQMLAVGRAMMAKPRLLLLDEPSLGLAPRAAREIFSALGALAKAGLTILLVEQKAPLALELARRVYVLRNGAVAAVLSPDQITSPGALAGLYLGAPS